MSLHAVVWIDHATAKVFDVDAGSLDELTSHALGHRDVHHRGGASGRRPDEDHQFLRAVAKSLGSAERVLIVGPASAKLELIRYLHRHDHGLEARVVGVETVDHPTDHQLVAYAKKYFKASDRMH